MMKTNIDTDPGAGACAWPTRETVKEDLRAVRRAATIAQHATEDAVSEAVLNIRRHPLRTVGIATLVGTLAGVVVGFGVGWLVRRPA
jgi:ElaB/YqjD/DUF883 family membrane-anchored ribosome-binding protein